jgi:subtilase family serine protease
VNSNKFLVNCSLLAAIHCATSQANASEKQLSGHVPAVVARLAAVGNVPVTNRLNLAIGLPLGDEKGLDDFVTQVYDPGSSQYRRYLTPAQFAQKFGPTEAQYTAVVDFAKQNHLTVTGRYASRLLVDVNGTVADIQRAFHVTLRSYRHPTEARDFYAPDTEPTIDATLPVADISGLNNYILPHPKNLRPSSAMEAANATPKAGSASGGAYFGKDFRAAYLPGVGLTGSGQMVGLLEFDGYYSADIAAYETAAGLPAVPLQTVLLDGYNGVPTRGPNSGNSEVSLDIEMAIAIAPGLSKVIVFEAGPGGLQNDILSAMAGTNQVKQLSCSWGWGGGPTNTTDNIFKQMAVQGQSFFDASGDTDAFTPGQVDDPTQTFAPSSCPYITLVGGTTLTTMGPGGAWSSETVWNAGGGQGSSGGISSYYPIPSWQMGVVTAANGGSTSYRNIPDVALVADNVYVYYGNGKSAAFVGTSCATPMWAGLTALVNQQAALGGRGPVGFLNPAVYAIGKGASYNACFHDITTGDNTWASSPSAFYATPGYDLCTGWGTPAGQSLVNALSGPPDPLGVSPSTGFVANGPAGGPFGPSSSVYLLTNSGAASLTWSVLGALSWLTGAPSQGALAPGATTSVAISLASAALNLAAGTYSATITFSNWTTHVAQDVSFSLQVGQSLVQNGGFETGDFSAWTLVGTTTVSTPTGSTLYNGVENLATYPFVVHSGNYGVFLGDTQVATLSQQLATLPGQAYLLSFWLDNPTNGTVQRFLVNWIAGGTVTNTLYDISSPPVLPWTNLQFLVTATSTNSILQFGAENDPNAFGLDDVSVTPIPTPGFKSVAVNSGVFSMTFRTLANLPYQLQYTTNLSQPEWLNLGTPITSTSSPLTVSDPSTIPQTGQRFYRLMLFP